MAKKIDRYWFKAKNYGWGWYPASWQGWTVLLIFIFLITVNIERISGQSYSASDIFISSFLQTTFLVIILISICYMKGEKPEWRWGGKKIKF